MTSWCSGNGIEYTTSMQRKYHYVEKKGISVGISAQDLAFEFDYALLLMPKMSVHMVY